MIISDSDWIRVSIHARFISRAIPYRLAACYIPATGFNPRPVYKPGDTYIHVPGYRVRRSFNPRPVYKPGDTRLAQHPRRHLDVSIHARFISRAIHLEDHPLWVPTESFNPRPVYKPGDTALLQHIVNEQFSLRMPRMADRAT